MSESNEVSDILTTKKKFCVNKIDKVGFDESVVENVKSNNDSFFLVISARKNCGLHKLIPIQDNLSSRRFNEIIISLRFENIGVTDQMKSKDKRFSVRWMEEYFNEILSNTYFSKFYTLDENLYRAKSRCQFLQYIPTKPDRIGLKTHVLASSSIRCVVAMKLCTGTRLNDNIIVIPNSGTDKFLGVNFCCDNCYSSLNLLKFLQSKSISFIGTLRLNRKEVDEDMDHCKTRELKSVKTKYIDGASLTSYKCKSNKTVLILSLIHEKVSIDPTTKKPNCVNAYNSLKGGVDVIDQ
uniref:DDE_Tnp_1_7 domain-containing protein n=1 Tax=Strongyloides venezuelensis TaxID=75913 RepID=A0A0K0F3V0_STRVS